MVANLGGRVGREEAAMAKTAAEMVAEAKQRVENLTVDAGIGTSRGVRL